jgi:hypothetical protein
MTWYRYMYQGWHKGRIRAIIPTKILNIAIQNVAQPNKSPVGVLILAYHPIYLGRMSVVFSITGRTVALE